MLLGSDTRSETFTLPTLVVAVSDVRDKYLLQWLTETTLEFSKMGSNVIVLHISETGEHIAEIDVPLGPDFTWSFVVRPKGSKGIGNTIKHFVKTKQAHALIVGKSSSKLSHYLARCDCGCPVVLVEKTDPGNYSRVFLPVIANTQSHHALKWIIPCVPTCQIYLVHQYASQPKKARKLLQSFTKDAPKFRTLAIKVDLGIATVIDGLRVHYFNEGKDFQMIAPKKSFRGAKIGNSLTTMLNLPLTTIVF